MAKREIAWGIRQYGMLLSFLIRSTRKQAIKDCCHGMRRSSESPRTWTQMRRRGFTVHKIEVRDAHR